MHVTHELGVAKILKKRSNDVDIVKSKEVVDLVDEKSVLFIVDTNKLSLTQNPKFAESVPTKIVIDHHDVGADTLQTKYSFIETQASSTCEMIALSLASKNQTIPEDISVMLLAGIVLDTNNFALKNDC